MITLETVQQVPGNFELVGAEQQATLAYWPFGSNSVNLTPISY